MRSLFTVAFAALFALSACNSSETATPTNTGADAQTSTEAVVQESKGTPTVGEGRLIPVHTEKGTFNVWTKKVGDNPTIKVLLLHGGPGMTHEIYEVFGEHFPDEGIEFYYYDQLGSYFSDQPDEPDLWTTARFVEEVEQVRIALGLGPDNFYLFGQSWGGILGIEYALKYQANLKGLIISNMMASIPAYNDYAANVLMADMDPAVLAKLKAIEAAKDYSNPEYVSLLIEHHYVDHVLRMPADQWPDAINRSFGHVNNDVYIPMQGPSELGASGLLENWDRTADLSKITVPTLIIGASHDTMDPAHMEWMAGQVANGRFHLCPGGSHLSQLDDEDVFFEGLIRFLRDVDSGAF
ncbi:proline iminopeptidase-family hydrolase [Kordiimonas aquimaris]|uniref:proline iminopeptidase-family hydrolase n=1 Tax=Kordiimonas aquimaris TaxID=707591 RepID=UPI0021D326A2|nr:proline iminopeptidase-family hydrolase [Kordiimonas aquimaris]